MEKFLEMKFRPCGILIATGSLFCCATLTGFAGSFWWVFDLVAHFPVQYFLSLACIAFILALYRRCRVVSVFTAFAILNFALIIPLYIPEKSTNQDTSRTFRAMLVNVQTSNDNFSGVVDLIKTYDPEFIVFEEVNSKWLKELRSLSKTYPYTVAQPRVDNFGIALFSRIPFQKADILYIGDASVPSVIASLDLGETSLTILGTHPIPPVRTEHFRLRNDQLAEIPKHIANVSQPVLLLGDLNVSPWSYYFRRLLKESGLRDSSRGNGFQPTWPTTTFLLLVPIDHCLYSPAIEMVNKELGPNIGSDHYPIVVDFKVVLRHEPTE